MLEEWNGRLTGVLRGLVDLAQVPPPRVRTRRRYLSRPRLDFRHTEGPMIRNERRWAQRTARAGRLFQSTLAQRLCGTEPSGPDQLATAWAFSFEQRARRKSAAAVSRRSRGLNLEDEQIDARFLNMPKHLYEELMRASARPYPTQFKEPGLEYIRGLMEEARR
jgi:hypothetical protein